MAETYNGYCVKCREPRTPDGAMAEFVVLTASTGNVRGLCPVCGESLNDAPEGAHDHPAEPEDHAPLVLLHDADRVQHQDQQQSRGDDVDADDDDVEQRSEPLGRADGPDACPDRLPDARHDLSQNRVRLRACEHGYSL